MIPGSEKRGSNTSSDFEAPLGEPWSDQSEAVLVGHL